MTADPRTFSSRAISFSMVCLVVRLCDSKPLSSLPRVATRTTAATLSTALSPADVAFNAAATFSAKVSSATSALMPRLKGGRLSALSSGAVTSSSTVLDERRRRRSGATSTVHTSPWPSHPSSASAAARAREALPAARSITSLPR